MTKQEETTIIKATTKAAAVITAIGVIVTGVIAGLSLYFVTLDAFGSHIETERKERDLIRAEIRKSAAPALYLCYKLNGSREECEP